MKKLAWLAAGAAVAFALTAEMAAADPIVVKIAHSSEADLRLPGSGRTAGVLAMKRFLESESNGGIEVQIYPNGELGSARSLIEQAQLGVIQVAGVYTSVMVPFVPEMAVTQIPYLFRDHLTAWKVMNGPFGDELATAVKKNTGLRVLGWADGGGFRQIYTSKPIDSLADLKGMKLRVPQNPGLLAMFKAWGASTVTIDWSELYTSLEAGMAEGTDTELYSMYEAKLVEVVPHVAMTHHSYNLHPLLMNKQFFQSLSPEYQLLMLQAGDLYTRVANVKTLMSAMVVKDAMKAAGATFYYPSDEDLEKFREVVQPAYIDAIVDQAGQEWIDKVMAAAKMAQQAP